MATLKGVGSVFGVVTSCTAGGDLVIAAATYKTGSDFNWTATMDELEDSDGDCVGVAVRSSKKELTITCVPAASTYANVVTEVNAILITPGSTATVTSAVSGGSLTDIAGSYMVTAVRFRETNTGFATYEVDLVKHADISSYATIT